MKTEFPRPVPAAAYSETAVVRTSRGARSRTYCKEAGINSPTDKPWLTVVKYTQVMEGSIV
ncbi:Uncharacterised protein [Mycobacterium tuberculosis]|nr:Uncharacterised protein [Mycobacterium tuberculosis]